MTFSNPIVGGTTLIRPAIHSPDYVEGSTGWSINKDGSAEFNDVTIRGDDTGDALVVGPDNGPQVKISSNSSVGFISFPTNRPIENRVSGIQAGARDIGQSDEGSALQILGPTVDGATDSAEIFLNSQNNDGSSEASIVMGAGSGVLGFTEDQVIVNGLKASALSSLSVNVDAGHTGNLYRATVGAVEKYAVASNGSVTSQGNGTFAGNLSANSIKTGTFTIASTSATDWSSNVAVTFPSAFTSAPAVTVTPSSGGPGTGTTTVLQWQVTGVTTTGFNCRQLRGNTGTTTFNYIAVLA